MRIFARILQIFGCIFFISFLTLNLCGFLCREQIIGGTLGNDIGSILSIFGYGMMLMLLVIFESANDEEDLFNFNKITIAAFIIIGIDVVYCMSIADNVHVENGSSFTASKLMITSALGMYINLSAVITSTNYLKKQK